jgi:hypothetical protein
MKKLSLSISLFSIAIVPALSYAVDSSSPEYQSGKIVGYVIGAAIVFVIVKKMMSK